jgi:cysteine desulfurase family protein (TIGR01976 family)
MVLDVDFVRSRFPAFRDPEARRWAFLENAGGSYVCQPVLDQLQSFMVERKVQPYGPFALSQQAGEAMDAGYRAIASWLATDPDQLTLGPSTSANTYVLAQALRPMLQPGDEIVVTNQDHEANIGAWRRLAEFGVAVREWRADASGELQVADLEDLVGPRTRIVCFSLCSNIVGTVAPLAQIVAVAKRHGALVVGDAVSFAPHLPLDLEASGLDFYLFSTYKVFATHLGVLWGRREALARTTNQSHYFNADRPRIRLNPAGPQHAEIAALAGLGSYFDEVAAHHLGARAGSREANFQAVWALIRDHETRLTERLLAGLERMPQLRVLGRGLDGVADRVSVVSVVPTGVSAAVLARGLGEQLVAVRNGHFYAVRLLEALGVDLVDGVLRISLVHYNTAEDVDRLLAGLEALLGR